jgi:hypothetical protein
MKITGFSFIKNAVKFDFPAVEAIKSVLPICDDFVIAVGECDDGTHDLINSIDPDKIRIVPTVWNEDLREGGRTFSLETDKAFAQIPEDSDWAFYIQGDEVIHETYLDTVYENMKRYKDDPKVDGLLFKYLHFYGSYDYVGASSNWYKNEIRVIKNDPSIYSYKDAQGFRKGNDEKLNVKPIDACIYHYGWVREPGAMQQKRAAFVRLYREDNPIDTAALQGDRYDYEKHVRELSLFEGEHPAIMEERIARINWIFDYDITFKKRSLKDTAKHILNRFFGIDLNYRNYKIV